LIIDPVKKNKSAAGIRRTPVVWRRRLHRLYQEKFEEKIRLNEED